GGLQQEPVELRLALDEGAEGGERRGQDLAGLARAGQRAGDLAVDLLGHPGGEGPDQAGLVAEVGVEDRLGDAGLGGDLVHRRLRAGAADGPLGGVEELGPALAAVPARAARASRPGGPLDPRRGLGAGHAWRGYPSTPSVARATRARSSSPYAASFAGPMPGQAASSRSVRGRRSAMPRR